METAARLADDYALTHKASFVNMPYPRKPYNPQSKQITPQSKPYSPQSGPKANPSNPTDNSSPKPKFSSENKGQNPLSQPICNYCKKIGHIISECLALKRKKEKEISQVPVCYYVKNGILMRKWRPPDVSAEDEWTVNHQIVVPRVS